MSDQRLTEWDSLDLSKFADEEAYLDDVLQRRLPLDSNERQSVTRIAVELVEAARSKARRKGVMESFLEEFGLSNSEGLALMCLAEALLRVPDIETRDELIAEKITSGNWDIHMGQSDSWLVNASTLGLMLTGRIVSLPKAAFKGPAALLSGLLRETGEPVIRAAVMQAMRIMGEQFVLGRTVTEALKRSKRYVKSGDAAHFSFDMLGEGARTAADADRYFEAYRSALETITQQTDPATEPENKSGISIKLSALHPRYEAVNEDRVMQELYPRVLALSEMASAANVNLCLDAEEVDRLILSMKIFERLVRTPSLSGWRGLGLAVQAYQKRALPLLEKLNQLAGETGQRLMVRLVKGAYWDSEIKHAQIEGFSNYPVFTIKSGTDLNYLTCADFLIKSSRNLYPQFATHNAHTFAAVSALVEKYGCEAYEFQRLHGMGEALYRAVDAGHLVRVYAPVGQHNDLLPYLVRRLLENGANSSFVNTFLDDEVPPQDIVSDPITRVRIGPRRHPGIPTPRRLFGANRQNSKGLDLSQSVHRDDLQNANASFLAGPQIKAGPIVNGSEFVDDGGAVYSPFNTAHMIGTAQDADDAHIDSAIETAQNFQPSWDRLGGSERAKILRSVADALEENRHRLISLIAYEAGRTLKDGIDEVREAVDFCRYYASQAEEHFVTPIRLPGPTGETNHLSLHGRGIFCCISPWNFPLAIFTGQIMAALAAGNTVIAKPAEQTPLISFETIKLFHAAGVPTQALHLLAGKGETVGARLTQDERISGYCLTGGTHTARIINRSLAAREGAIPTLIAETGGLNGMFVDTTALREQVIDDILASAFGSAGQRCSATRVAFLPDNLYDTFVESLIGAMNELKVGDPSVPTTDIGPIVDADARAMQQEYLDNLPDGMTLLHQIDTGEIGQTGYGFGPALVELTSLSALKEEKFGPILHLVRYEPDDLTALSSELEATDYGLTLGIHSRLESFQKKVREACPVGNTYVNRSMIGAVVGVQPFGGDGVSGTGPKAGGPFYLHRFATERTLTVNMTAQGGDPELLNLSGF